MRLVTRKTSTAMTIPMAQALRSHIESLPAGELLDALLHPRAFRGWPELTKPRHCRTNSRISLPRRDCESNSRTKATAVARLTRPRDVFALSFHSLRRAATTWLHEAGIADAVAQSSIDHSSEAVHDTYIWVGREALKNLVAAFPWLSTTRS
jgi:integrase